ncbi:MAG: sulfatase-like hydrolase/transferase [Acidobacteriota bacterium]
MSRNIFLALTLLLSLTVVSPGKGKGQNILLVTIDTIRFDRIGIHTKKFVKTPNIDKLGKKSIIFKRAFAHTPLTLPSHTNILTGTTPLFHGISDNNRFRLDDKFLTLAEHLKSYGYDTGAFVGSFVLSKYFKLNQGFDLYSEPEKSNELIARDVIVPSVNWLKKRDKPWFLWVHLWDPHTPYDPPEPFKSRYNNDLYSGEVAYMDSQLGYLFDYLTKKGLMENTTIVITGDHGEALGDHGETEHGYFAYNETIHIPLIIYNNSLKPAIIKNNVSHIDIFPTICDLAGIKTPGDIQGRSLIPLIQNKVTEEIPIYIEAKSAYHSKGWAPLEGYITKDRKFIDLPIKELYDLKNDFREKKNIISRVNITGLYRVLNSLKEKLSGKYSNLSRKEIDPTALKKLKSFGYLTGIVQKKKARFTREDDLKVLLPIQQKLTRARKLSKNGKYNEALKLYMEVKKERPDNIAAILHMSEIFHKTNRIKAGITIIEEGLGKNPENRELKLRYGILLVADNRFIQGKNYLLEVLKEDKNSGEAWHYLGIAYFKGRQPDKALESYLKALDTEKTNPQLFNNMGTLYLTQFLKSRNSDLLDKAISGFKQALSLNPDLPSALNGLGAAYRFSGNKEQAIIYWKRALKNKQDFIQVYFNLGITLIELGRKEEAGKLLNFLKEKYYSKLSPRDKNQLHKFLSYSQ